MPRLIIALLALILAACGTRPGLRVPREAGSPRPSPPPARAEVPRPAAPSPPGKSFPECDPRHGDPDRGRAALGLLAGDCQDERGRNRVYVTRLVPVGGSASPAQRAGVQAGDRIVRLDACEVTSTHVFAAQLRSAVPGWVARLVVERNGRELEAFVPTIGLSGGGKSAASEPSLSTAGCQAIGRKAAKP